MEFKNDEEVLDFMTRLLERLHQTGNDQQGSHFQFVYVQACTQQTLPNPFPSEARRPVAFSVVAYAHKDDFMCYILNPRTGIVEPVEQPMMDMLLEGQWDS